MDSVKVATACGAGATSDRRSTSDQCDASEDEEKCLIVDVVGESEDDDDAASTVEPNLSVDADCTDTSPVRPHDVTSPVPRKAATDTLPTRQRRMVSDEQRRVLCETFDRDPYPSKYQREAMAAQLDMDERRIRSWFQNHRTQLQRSASGSLRESVSPLATIISRVEHQTFPADAAQTPKREPASRSTLGEYTPLAAHEAPIMATGSTSRVLAASRPIDGARINFAQTNSYQQMSQTSLSPSHPFYFLTDGRDRTEASLKRKSPSTKEPSAKAGRHRPRPPVDPRRRRMTPRQRREHRKLTLQMMGQATVAPHPDQPLDLSMKPDRLTPPANSPSSAKLYCSAERRASLPPMVARNPSDLSYYPLAIAMGLMPYSGVNHPYFHYAGAQEANRRTSKP